MCPTPAFPLQPCLLPLGGRSFCGTTANDNARARLSGSGDRRLMFALDSRVRDLKNVENTHGYVVDQMGQCAGHADKPHLAGLFELQECVERTVFIQGLTGWRRVELYDVEIVGLHPHKT